VQCASVVRCVCDSVSLTDGKTLMGLFLSLGFGLVDEGGSAAMRLVDHFVADGRGAIILPSGACCLLGLAIWSSGEVSKGLGFEKDSL